jgi:hypothetical protein
MIARAQTLAAQAALGWSAHELADRSGFSPLTILRLEEINGARPCSSSTLMDLRGVL